MREREKLHYEFFAFCKINEKARLIKNTIFVIVSYETGILFND